MRSKLFIFSSFLAIFLAFQTKNAEAQELIFSQFYNAEMLYNPADAGHFLGFGAQLLTRTQWSNLESPIRSNYFSASYGFHRKDDIEHHLGGIGIEFHNYDAGNGNLNVVGFSVNPAYNIYLDEAKTFDMSFGLKIGYDQRGIDPNSLRWGTQFDPSQGYNPNLPIGESNLVDNVNFLDIGAGIDFMYRPEKTSHQHPLSFFLKLAGSHLTQPNVSFFGVEEKLQMAFNADLGVRKGFSESFTMGFDFFALSQGSNLMVQPGVFALYKLHTVDHGLIPHELKFGVAYRVEDAAIFSLEFGNHNYSLGFSYDSNVSSLSEFGGAYSAFEISLRAHIMKKVHKGDKPNYYFHSPRT